MVVGCVNEWSDQEGKREHVGSMLGIIRRNWWNWQSSKLKFANDTAIVTDSEEKLRRLVVGCMRDKPTVNVGTSQITRCLRNDYEGGISTSPNGELEEMEFFKYLGSNLAKCGGLEMAASLKGNKGSNMLETLKC